MANLTECFPVAEIIRCSNFAAAKHKNQRRKDTEKTPYINHPIGLCSKHIVLSFHSFYFFVPESDTFNILTSNPVHKMCKQAVFVQDPHTLLLLSTHSTDLRILTDCVGCYAKTGLGVYVG